jgi:hypothetical protein
VGKPVLVFVDRVRESKPGTAEMQHRLEKGIDVKLYKGIVKGNTVIFGRGAGFAGWLFRAVLRAARVKELVN